MNIVTRDTIDIHFKLLVKASNENNARYEKIYYYKLQGMIEALHCANILSDKAYDFLINSSDEVYLNGNEYGFIIEDGKVVGIEKEM